MNAAEFNARYPVGTPVLAYPGFRPEDVPDTRRLVTRTRSEAQAVGLDREGVVWVDGHGAYIALTHIDVITEAEFEAARAAETAAAVAEQGALPMPGAIAVADDPNDRRRCIYIDGKGNGWIDLSVDPSTGERDLTGITDAWKIATATEVRDATGSLREIGRCW